MAVTAESRLSFPNKNKKKRLRRKLAAAVFLHNSDVRPSFAGEYRQASSRSSDSRLFPAPLAFPVSQWLTFVPAGPSALTAAGPFGIFTRFSILRPGHTPSAALEPFMMFYSL
jgi:hypothetical protein